jgi:hypothetical protein
MTVEIFITNVAKKEDSDFLIHELLKIFPDSEISFDLEDCDRILRIKSLSHEPVACGDVIFCLDSNGFACNLLTD